MKIDEGTRQWISKVGMFLGAFLILYALAFHYVDIPETIRPIGYVLMTLLFGKCGIDIVSKVDHAKLAGEIVKIQSPILEKKDVEDNPGNQST